MSPAEPKYGPAPEGPPLSVAEVERGQAQWALMPPEMREFVARLVENGGINGRRMLAECNVKITKES